MNGHCNVETGERERWRGGMSDRLKLCAQDTFNRQLLPTKLFYFCFYSALGSLFPMLGVYFKQLGLSSLQAGVIIGLRPLIEMFAGPFWVAVNDKYKKGKPMLMIATLCWIGFTVALMKIRPETHGCLVANFSAMRYQVVSPAEADQYRAWLNTDVRPLPRSQEHGFGLAQFVRQKRSVDEAGTQDADADADADEQLEKVDVQSAENEIAQSEDSPPVYDSYADVMPSSEAAQSNSDSNKPLSQLVNASNLVNPRKLMRPSKAGFSPIILSDAPLNIYSYMDIGDDELVKTPYSFTVYLLSDVTTTFVVLFFVTLVSEFVCSPTSALADYSTIMLVDGDVATFAKQRVCGPLGWGLAIFSTALALDFSGDFPDHPCAVARRERNYFVCFVAFFCMMSLCFLLSAFLTFRYDGDSDGMECKVIKDRLRALFTGKVLKARARLDDDESSQSSPPRDTNKPDLTSDCTSPSYEQEQLAHAAAGQRRASFKVEAFTASFWADSAKQLRQPALIGFLIVVCFFGMGNGLTFAFLWWHLQDHGAFPTLFGIASILNYVAEVSMFFASSYVVLRLGQIKLLYVALICNAVRFLYVSWITDPWWVIPFEIVQGLLNACIWAACISYVNEAIAVQRRQPTQMLIHGLYYSFGRGCGAILGGLTVDFMGSELAFRLYGILSIFVLVGYILLNKVAKGGLIPSPTYAPQPPGQYHKRYVPSFQADSFGSDEEMEDEQEVPKDKNDLNSRQALIASPFGFPLAPSINSRLSEMSSSRSGQQTVNIGSNNPFAQDIELYTSQAFPQKNGK